MFIDMDYGSEAGCSNIDETYVRSVGGKARPGYLS